jgi:hypothetical protein
MRATPRARPTERLAHDRGRSRPANMNRILGEKITCLESIADTVNEAPLRASSSGCWKTGELRMNKSCFLAFVAAAGALPLAIVATNLGTAARRADADTARAPAPAPDLLAAPHAAEVVDAAAYRQTARRRSDRADAPARRPLVEFTGRLEPAQWHLFPGNE